MYQMIYKCRLCGEQFPSLKNINLLDEKYAGYFFRCFHQNSAVVIKHECQDGSFGVADFQGYKRVNEE